MNAWKVATFVFGISLVVLATRNWQRGRAESGSRTEAVGRTQVDQSQRGAPAGHGAATGNDAAPAGTEAAMEPLPGDPREFLKLLLWLDPEAVDHPGRPEDDESCFKLLRSRAEEVLPIVRGWLDREAELREGGIGVRTIYEAYAAILGEEAVPLLRTHGLRCVGNGERAAALYGLFLIEHPGAIEAIEAIQAEAGDYRDYPLIQPLHLFSSSPLHRALAFRWAVEGPPNHSELRHGFRAVVFAEGTDDERLELWPMVKSKDYREMFCWSMLQHGGADARATAERIYLDELSSDDAQVWARTTAMLLNPSRDWLPRRLVERAEARARRELASPTKPDADDVSLRRLHRVLRQREEKRRAREKQRELLDR